ncbi:MAG: hypothetical protein ACRBCK_01560 [Alphaproteobacteria bacterium]
MASTKLHSFSKVAVNTITDPAVLLSTGGSIVVAEQSPIAASINFSTSILCASVRAVNEIKKQNVTVPTPRSLDLIFESKGGSQITASGIKMCAAADAARIIDFARPETFFNFGAMVGTSIANFSRGFSFSTRPDSTLHKCLDVTGIGVPALVYSFSNPEAPELLVAGYAASTLLAVDRSVRENANYALRQPEMLMCATLWTSAATSTDPYIIAGSTLWGAGYLSQDMLRKHGGVAEGMEDFAENVKEGLSGATNDLRHSCVDFLLYALNTCTDYKEISLDPENPYIKTDIESLDL